MRHLFAQLIRGDIVRFQFREWRRVLGYLAVILPDADKTTYTSQGHYLPGTPQHLEYFRQPVVHLDLGPILHGESIIVANVRISPHGQ
jgi:hypothetical protein